MEIINLGIANFRSFDSEGISIENLSKLNIFIGKNNSGKSKVRQAVRQGDVSSVLFKQIGKHVLAR